MRVTTIPLGLIHPDPDNVRDGAADADIDSLAADIRAHGLLQPLIVYPRSGLAGHYMISGGHRRLAALRALGISEAPCNVIGAPGDDLMRLDLMAAENLQRRQLDPIERARLYKRYIDRGLMQKDIAARLHVAQATISQLLPLLDLPADVQRKIKNREIGFAQAVKLGVRHRNETGPRHGLYGRSKATSGLTVPYFNSRHPLYEAARRRCVEAAHGTHGHIGGACGGCWERVIRLDAGGIVPLPHNQRPVEHFSDPRDILRRLSCTRCRTPALDREQRRCTEVRDGKRVFHEHHRFAVEVAPALGVSA